MTKLRSALGALVLMTTILAAGCASGGPDTDPDLDGSLFNAIPGEPVVTGGWADAEFNGTGVAYAASGEGASAVTWITDEIYPNALDKRLAFTGAIASDSPRFIVVAGDIDLSDGLISDDDKSAFEEFDPVTHARVHADITYNIGSNTTIIGVNDARLMFGGLTIDGELNVIIRNVSFYDAHGSTAYDTSIDGFEGSKASIDALVVEGESAGIWIDHCTFSDGTCSDRIRNYHHDGLFDIKQASSVTVSYSVFTNHDKVMLVGSNDTDYLDPEERRVTLHHNYFHGTSQRMPRSRGTMMHVYNNYYERIGVADNPGYSLGPGIGSLYIVEANLFGQHLGSIIKYYDSSPSAEASTYSWFFHSGNEPVLSPSYCAYDSGVDSMKDFDAHVTTVMPWTIPYEYSLDEAARLSSTLPIQVGSGQTVAIDGTIP
jgi:pectate lyase